MSYEEEVLVRLRRAIKEGAYFGPVSERDIEAAEAEIGVLLTGSYRVFLKHYGAAWINPPFEAAGITDRRHSGPEMPLWQHIVDVTLTTRRATRGSIPHEWLPIADDGMDHSIYLNTSIKDKFGESPMFVLGPGMAGIRCASSFVEFVERAAFDDPFPR